MPSLLGAGFAGVGRVRWRRTEAATACSCARALQALVWLCYALRIRIGCAVTVHTWLDWLLTAGTLLALLRMCVCCMQGCAARDGWVGAAAATAASWGQDRLARQCAHRHGLRPEQLGRPEERARERPEPQVRGAPATAPARLSACLPTCLSACLFRRARSAFYCL